MHHRVGAVVAAAIAATLVLSGCSSATTAAPGAGPSVTIGSQTGVANQVVAQLYGQALVAKGYTVDYNYGIGSRATFLSELQNGIVDVVPDFAGSLLDAVEPTATASSTEDVMTQLPPALKPLGLSVASASDAEKSRVYVTTKEFATAHSLTSIGDLAPIASALTFGSTESLDTDAQARDSLEFSYGVENFLYREGDDDDSVLDDLRSGAIQVADISSINVAAADGLVVLTDPKHVVVAQNIVPLIDKSARTSTLVSALDAVSAKLTSKDLSSFGSIGKELPSTVAARWLKHQGIVD